MDAPRDPNGTTPISVRPRRHESPPDAFAPEVVDLPGILRRCACRVLGVSGLWPLLAESNRVRARVRLRLADVRRHTPTDTPTAASGPYQQTLVVFVRLAPQGMVALDSCEHAFPVTSQGHLPAQFAHACGNYKLAFAFALAAQLKPLSLSEALSLLPLIAGHEPERFEAAASKWHGRWLLERAGADLAGSALVLAALGTLRGSRREAGLRLLRAMV